MRLLRHGGHAYLYLGERLMVHNEPHLPFWYFARAAVTYHQGAGRTVRFCAFGWCLDVRTRP